MPLSLLPSYERYLAVDLHKHYVVIGGLNARQEMVLPPRRIDLSDWPTWAKAHLQKTDILVVEATTNAWDFYDQVQPLVGRCVVANAGKIAGLVKTRVKTDRVDVLKLARLLVAGMIPEVWVPPLEVRELRALLAHRRQLMRNFVPTEPYDAQKPFTEHSPPPSARAPGRRVVRRQKPGVVDDAEGLSHGAPAHPARSNHLDHAGAADCRSRDRTPSLEHHLTLDGASHFLAPTARLWRDHHDDHPGSHW
jgi:hypothetical protein